MSRRQRERKRAGEGVGASHPSQAAARTREGLVFTPWTGIYGGAGLATVLLGFFLLGQGSLAVGPILLVIGFLVFFPLALVK
jgi:hypothetical protein